MLLKQIRQIHAESRDTYGSPRVHAELTLGLGLPVNLKRIARLMRDAGIWGLYRRRRRGCTLRDPDAEPSSDLVNREVTVAEPNRLWITDITEHPHARGQDLLRRGHGRLFPARHRLVHRRAHAHRTGHRCARHGNHSAQTTRTTRQQLDRAALRHGSQYTSWAFGQRLRAAGLLASMGTVGDCYDNAMMESFWGTMQLELLDSKVWATRDELANAIFEWIECWYNPNRRHSSIGMHSPVTFETLHTGSDEDH